MCKRGPVAVNVFVACAAAVSFSISPVRAASQMDRDLTVVTVGVADARYGVSVPDVTTAYFSVLEPLTLNCQPLNFIYLDTTNSVAFPGQAYQMILLAKQSGKKLTRVDYEQRGPAGQCFLKLIQLD